MLSSRGARLSPRILPSFRQSYSSGPNANPRPRPPPRSLLHFDTIYPFILLSAITSLALNLSHSRSTFTNLADHLRAQISVLEAVLANERLRVGLTPEEQDDIERQLELVGLGRAKGRESKEAIKGRFGTTAWREVFFGKKGDEWEVDVDADGKEADWEKRAFFLSSFCSLGLAKLTAGFISRQKHSVCGGLGGG